MNIASIDIGSNTVLLLIANSDENNKINTVLNKYEIPRISKGLQKKGEISKGAIERLINVLSFYDRLISEYNCEVILVNATNALRISGNGQEIVSLLEEKFGYDVKIIAGKEEARLSYLGATFENQRSRNVVVDIGGGSTEIIIGRGSDLEFAESMNIGAVSLTEKHCSSLPPNSEELNNITSDITGSLNKLNISDRVGNFNGLMMTAVAGTPTTLSSIKQNLKEYIEESVEGSELTRDDLDSISTELALYKPSEVLEKYGDVVKGREDVLLTGTILLKIIADYFGTYKIRVSGRGIRYGAVIDYITNQI